MKFVHILLILLISTLFIACGNEATNETTDNSAETTKTETTDNGADDTETEPADTEEKTATDENKLATPKDSIAYQFDLVKKGDYETLKKCCFTERAAKNLTKETVDSAQKNSSDYTMEDLVDKVEEGESDGKKTAKIKMKNGRTLTTLIETDGKWLADSIWFN